MTSMTAAQAEDFIYRHDRRARELTRMTKAGLAGLRGVRDQAAGITRWGGAQSKDELVSELLEQDYPTGQLNQAIHVKYHVTGIGGSSACEYCHPHGGGRCDCSPRALELELARRALEPIGSQRHQTAGCECAECIKAAAEAEGPAEQAIRETEQVIAELNAKYDLGLSL